MINLQIKELMKYVIVLESKKCAWLKRAGRWHSFHHDHHGHTMDILMELANVYFNRCSDARIHSGKFRYLVYIWVNIWV